MAKLNPDKHLFSILAEHGYDTRYYALVDRAPVGVSGLVDNKALEARLEAHGLTAKYFKKEGFFRCLEHTDGVETWLHLSFRPPASGEAKPALLEVGMYWHMAVGLVGGPAHLLANRVAKSLRRRPRKPPYPRIPFGELADCPIAAVLELWRETSTIVSNDVILAGEASPQNL